MLFFKNKIISINDTRLNNKNSQRSCTNYLNHHKIEFRQF